MPCLKWFSNKTIPMLNFERSAGGQSDNLKLKTDPDEKWSNLYREKQKNSIYKWVDGTQKGGELMNIFEEFGDEGVLKFLHEKVSPLLYNDGASTDVIKFAEYNKWKKSMSVNLAGKEEIALTDAQDNFVEHPAQWRLNKRGVEGETLVHLLLNRDDAKSTEVARIMINEYPGLALDIYEGDEMYGQSSLHIAIVHEDYEFVCLLMDKQADVNQRANGRFFLPDDQKLTSAKKQTNYSGFAYYGEYPLAFAACFGNKDIYDILIQYGADPNRQDSFGNTVLHMCVINNSIEMYGYAVRHWSKPADVNVINSQGQTPLTLASKLGRREIFEEMLELMKVEFWRFSDMACSAYPLTALDTIKPDGSTNWDSALMTVINGNTPDHMDMVGSEVIQRLLADKWKAYGSRKMYERLLLLLLHLLCMSVAVYLRPKDTDLLLKGRNASDYARYVAELITIVGCVSFVLLQQGGEIKAQGLAGYIRSLRTAPDKGIFFVVNILIVLCIPWRFAGFVELEEASLVLALPGSWVFLLFFARGALLTGPFVQMIYSMIAGDILRFLIVAFIFLLSFAQAFFFVGKDIRKRQELELCDIPTSDHVISSYETFLETVMTLIRASVGSYEYDDFECAHYIPLIKVMSVLYMIIMPIMLVNMLIAMMGNTYTRVISQAEKAWRQQWAQIVIILERALSKEKLAKHQTEYSIKISDDKDTGMETRGLMVIKQTKKTKARQRKQAVNNWKRMCRKVAQTMHQQKAQAAQATQQVERANSGVGRNSAQLRGKLQAPVAVLSDQRRVSRVLNVMLSPENDNMDLCKTPQLTIHHTADSPVPVKSNALTIGDRQWTTESYDSLSLPPAIGKRNISTTVINDSARDLSENTTNFDGSNASLNDLKTKSAAFSDITQVVTNEELPSGEISSPNSASNSSLDLKEEATVNYLAVEPGSTEVIGRRRSSVTSLTTPRVTVETLPNMPHSTRVTFQKDAGVESKRKSSKDEKKK